MTPFAFSGSDHDSSIDVAFTPWAVRFNGLPGTVQGQKKESMKLLFTAVQLIGK